MTDRQVPVTPAAIAAETPAARAGITTAAGQADGFTTMTAARSVAIIRLVWPIWGCRRAMHAGDYTVGAGGGLPSESIVSSWGSKNIIDPERAKPLHRCRSAAANLLDASGVRIADSEWAVPETSAAGVLRQLEAIRAEFDTLRQGFLDRLDTYIEEWKDANPEDAARIEADRVTREEVARRISAQVRDFRLAPRGGSAGDAAALDETILGDITGGFFRDLRDWALGLSRGAIRSGRAGKRTVDSLLRMRNRIARFASFTPGLVPVLEVMDRVTRTMPREGWLPAGSFAMLSQLVATLADRAALEDLSTGAITPDGWMLSACAAGGLAAAVALPGSLDLGEFAPIPQPVEAPAPAAAPPPETVPGPVEADPPQPVPTSFAVNGPAASPAAFDAPPAELLAELASGSVWLSPEAA